MLAGPGSGKTRVITRRIARIIEQGVDPARVLAITFTNKAAGEMADRVARLLPGHAGLDQHVSPLLRRPLASTGERGRTQIEFHHPRRR